ncbi:molybdopterin biosynthesis protein MoeA [Rhodanobacter sp. Root627]|uniref:molybdopterin molybdotransferase MoeA n=1 Tax=Rhodanobacter sp. Root627 TaxID=1736572 RepID=UPI0006F3991A|nr:molybdopterin molybdotransferase MoeA [Rhodanobacter sp. Root627]KRA35544.1 molybdopterin biosynthesis protein MoeA [Rhodanobacter sp. Root627]
MKSLLSVAEAEQRIHAHMPSFGTERVALDAATGRVLRQSVQAERDQPPFDRVMMDGIAIATVFSSPCSAGGGWEGVRLLPFRSKATPPQPSPAEQGREQSSITQQRFRRAGLALAGMDEQVLDDPAACIEVTTGAMLPRGCDSVVPIEQTRRDGERFVLSDGYEPTAGQFIHPRGADCGEGELLLRSGTRIRSPEVAVLAANGAAQVEVAKRPSVTIVATGDELREVDQALAPGQIRRSNDRALAAALATRGFDDVERTWLPDDLNIATQVLAGLLATRQVLVLSGGVSVGQRDFVPAALHALGVQEVLHGIAQRPGKPMWFGIGPQGQVIFALPGNPVSALVCAVRYLLPALEHAIGLTAAAPVKVVLADAAATHPALTCFVPVDVQHDDHGRAMARPQPSPTSGDFSSLPQTHGVVELAPAAGAAPVGTVAALYRW